jgi:hypothetical protein
VVAVTYQVEVSREGDAWVADVANLDGAHTYARDLGTLMRNVDEVIRLVADLDDAEQYGVQWVWNVDEVEREAIALGEEKRRLDALERKRAARASELAAQLVARGVKVRDAAAMLGVSPGRISQLTSGAPREQTFGSASPERTIVGSLAERTIIGPRIESVDIAGVVGRSVVEHLRDLGEVQLPQMSKFRDEVAASVLAKAARDSLKNLPKVTIRGSGALSAFGDVHSGDEV